LGEVEAVLTWFPARRSALFASLGECDDVMPMSVLLRDLLVRFAQEYLPNGGKKAQLLCQEPLRIIAEVASDVPHVCWHGHW
jgi:hypothetical protein